MSKRSDSDDEGTLDHNPVVLVVDDQKDLADLYSQWLSDDYAVQTAYNGEQALERLDETVDVVLLDRRMPDLSSDEALNRIRELSRFELIKAARFEPPNGRMELLFDALGIVVSLQE